MRQITSIILMLSLFAGCTTPLTVEENPSDSTDAATDSGTISQEDVAVPADAGDSDADLDSFRDGGNEVNWSSPEDLDLWTAARPCSAPTTNVETVSTSPFEVPPGGEFEAAWTRERILSEGAEGFDQWSRIFFDSKYGTLGDRQPFDIFVEPGEDVVLHVHLFDSSRDQDYVMSTFLDYEPVSSNFKQVTGDRKDVIKESVGTTGFIAHVDRRLVLTDVTIPAEEFTPGRTHELVFAFVGSSRGAQTSRYQVHYGGYGPPPDPLECVVSPLGTERSIFEGIMYGLSGPRVATIFNVPHPTGVTYLERTVSTGETVRIYSSIFRKFNHIGPTQIFLQPTLNGKPVGDPIWRSRNGPSDLRRIETIDSRDYFDITLPDEPGLYYFNLVAVEDPWKRWRPFGETDPSADGYHGYSNIRNHQPGSSNIIRFQVVEPRD